MIFCDTSTVLSVTATTNLRDSMYSVDRLAVTVKKLLCNSKVAVNNECLRRAFHVERKAENPP